MPLASPLPEGRSLICPDCKTIVTYIGKQPERMLCPCGGTFRLATEKELQRKTSEE